MSKMYTSFKWYIESGGSDDTRKIAEIFISAI